MAPGTTGFTIMRKLPRVLPDVLDLLVVGGGPGGTMTAFRARELGLKALVVDYDDVLKRIRDYSKDKLILPDFGGGDRMRFPEGGALARKLHFQPIDKDEMHQKWKRFYLEHDVPVQVGIELTGLERDSEQVWRARVWDHNEREERSLPTRCVAIAIGRGVPRRFDVPGNTDGIAYRLSDPALYLGQPACVIGGGTSAAEAVIAISRAKIEADDSTAVYWSYRGDRLPRVSKALAEVFFEAYLGNGNIRYQPLSEPAAVVMGGDREEYLAIRVDRRCLEGRPHETVHLEFPKQSCIACIGEDIPETFLSDLGIPMVPTRDGGRKRMLVSPHLETVQPNVFLVGDMLSQAFFETDDFGADPSTYREVKHPGNIKSALRDGVLVAEVVAQKVSGAKEIRVQIRDAEPVAGVAEDAATSSVPVAGVSPVPRETGAFPVAAAVPPDAEVVPEREPAARLVRVLPGGVDGEEYPLPVGAALSIGSGEGVNLRFPDDTALSERHASIAPSEEGPVLRDDGGATGVFLRARVSEHTELAPGTVFRAGRQFLVLGEGEGGAWELRHFDHRGTERGRHPVTQEARIFGRDAPDVVLEPTDSSLSRRHFAASVREGAVFLKDLKSVNGTWLKVKAATVLRPGDELRVGHQTMRYGPVQSAFDRPAAIAPAAARQEPGGRPAAAPAAAQDATPSAAPAAAPAAAPPGAPAAAGSGSPSVTFGASGKTVELRPGQTLCEAAEENGLPINAECHAGICGSDPIRIVSGAEHLSPLEDSEAETLEELCSLEPGEYRLACMCRAQGPVVVELAAPKA